MEPLTIFVVCIDQVNQQYLAFAGNPRKQATGDSADAAVIAALKLQGLTVDVIDAENTQPVQLAGPGQLAAPAATAAIAATAAVEVTQVAGMTFSQAAELMTKEGARVTRPGLEDHAYLCYDPAFHPHWALHLLVKDAEGKTKDQAIAWPQRAPKHDTNVRIMLAARDWKVAK